jgi:hypothetical protein
MESELIRSILLEFGSRKDLRLWRANCGVAYGIDIVKKCQQQGYIPWNLPATRYGVKGMADIQGIKWPGGRHISIECKSAKGKQTPEQKVWQGMVEELGGIYILAYSLEDVRRVLP